MPRARGLRVLSMAVGLAGLLGAGVAEARSPGKSWRKGPPPIERVLERHAERLGLDASLRARIQELAHAGQEATLEHRAALQTLRDELHVLLSAESPDEQAVLGKAEEIGAVETALKKQRLRTMLAIRALLSPEQRRELVRIHRERREERRSRRGGADEGTE